MAIDKRPSGKWRIRVQSGRRPDGSQRRVSHTLPATASRADALRAEALLDIEIGVTTAEGDLMPLREVVALDLNRSDGTKALTTQHADRAILRRWLADTDLGGKPIAKIRTSDLERHYVQILDRTGEKKPGTVGPATVRQLHSLISHAHQSSIQAVHHRRSQPDEPKSAASHD